MERRCVIQLIGHVISPGRRSCSLYLPPGRSLMPVEIRCDRRRWQIEGIGVKADATTKSKSQQCGGE